MKHSRSVALLACCCLMFFSGQVLAESVLRLELPAAGTTASPKNKTVVIRKIEDTRTFEDHPPTPDIPSLAAGVTRASAETRARAIGRARNGYGKALHNVYLEEGRSVDKLMHELVTAAFRNAGYTVREGTTPMKGDIQVTVEVPQFWGWIRIDAGSIYMDGAIRSVVHMTGGSAPERIVDLNATASHRLGIGVTGKNWRKLYRLLFEDYMEAAAKRL